MPRGLYRFHQSQTPHFITFTSYRRRPHLNDPSARDQFVKSLERTRTLYRFFVYGFVVMPNHIHLLISEPQSATIRSVMQSLKIASAKRRVAWVTQPLRRNNLEGSPFKAVRRGGRP